jgi:ubiquinone/menaquinone biosynthesis C-methylase UbiE
MSGDLHKTYLHGFSQEEQDRLVEQARLIEPHVFAGINLDDVTDLLEVGMGVGAQTSILLRRYPKIKITGIDLADEQIAVAKDRLKAFTQSGQLEIIKADATNLTLINKQFDAAFICWFLEHVPDPLKVLKEVRQKLRPGGRVYITEVYNSSLFIEPYSPNSLKYWFEFNDFQWTNKGHPFIGLKLGNLLVEAGFSEVKVEPRPLWFDQRNPQRKKTFFDYFLRLFLSGKNQLLKDKRIDDNLIEAMKKEFAIARDSKDGVFYYDFIHGEACNG